MSIRVGTRWVRLGHKMVDLCRVTHVRSRLRLWCLFDEDKPYVFRLNYQADARFGDNGKRWIDTRCSLEECKRIEADIQKAQDNLMNEL